MDMSALMWFLEGTGEWLSPDACKAKPVYMAQRSLVLRACTPLDHGMVAMIVCFYKTRGAQTEAGTWWCHRPRVLGEQPVTNVRAAIEALTARGVAAPPEELVAELENWVPAKREVRHARP